MAFTLSSRLLACCGFVPKGSRVADIGCDHGYLSIHLLQQEIASFAYACDVNQGPLQSALRNAHKYGVEDRMSFYLSNGVRNVPRDFDVMVCAGMGADTMISILEAAPWLQSPQYTLVLQCQSKSPALRQYLSSHGWCIGKETVLRDGRFLYTVMAVTYRPEASALTVGGCYFPPAMLEVTSSETAAYYQRILFSLRRAIRGRGEHADPNMVAALAELNELTENPALHWLRENLEGDCVCQP